MKKFLIISAVIVALIFGIRAVLLKYTKAASPESLVTFENGDVKINVFYNSPSKKGRKIFGGLVPYNTVWRTGANEATIFETNTDLSIQGKVLKAGKYSLWTIPNEQSWEILFNSETGQWGIDFNGVPNRNADNDVLTAQVPALRQEKEIEKFTISVEKAEDDFQLVLMWDQTVVTLPMSIAH
jgi:hypothetical protein